MTKKPPVVSMVAGLIIAIVGVVLWWNAGPGPVEQVGGIVLTCKLQLSPLDAQTEATCNEARDVIAKRLHAIGVSSRVAVKGTDTLVVELPGAEKDVLEWVRPQIEIVGDLTFRLVAEGGHQDPEKLDLYEEQERKWLEADRQWVREKLANPGLPDRRPEPPPFLVRHELERKLVDNREGFVPKPDSKKALENRHVYNASTERWERQGAVSGRHFTWVVDTVDPYTYQPALSFELDEEGASLFGNLTGNNKGRHLSIVLDDAILQTATIEERITSRGQITGDFTSSDVLGLASVLRGQNLPVPMSIESQEAVTGEGGFKAFISSPGNLCLLLAAAGALFVVVRSLHYLVRKDP